MRKPTIFIDDEDEIELPCKREICSHCRGNGKSSAHLGAIAQRRIAILALAALALSACAVERSPAGSAMPHGTTSAPVECPEQDPAQPNCRVPR